MYRNFKNTIMTTLVKTTKGKDLKVKGSVNEVVSYFKSKGANILPSRINNNLTIWINGKNVGEIQC